MARNRYDPYAQPYLASQAGGDIVYQPQHDPNETNRLTDLLAKRQERYDVGSQKFSDFQGQVGGMQTYGPDALNKQLEGFSGKVKDVVQNQYGGDYGLAANEITQMIAEEKSNPFYKMVAKQNEQVKLMQDAELKYGKNNLIVNNDPRSQQALEQAYALSQMSQEDRDGVDPYSKITADYAERDDYAKYVDSQFKDLTANMKTEISGYGSNGLLTTSQKGITEKRINKNVEDSVDTFLKDNSTFAMEHKGTKEQVREAAKDYMKGRLADNIYSQETKRIGSNPNAVKKDSEDNAPARPYSFRTDNNFITDKYSSLIKSTNKKLKGFDLDTWKPYDNTGKVGKAVGVSAKLKGDAVKMTAEQVEAFAEMMPTMGAMLEKAGVKSEWIRNLATSSSPTAITAEFRKLETKGISKGLDVISKGFYSVAKIASGAGTKEDANQIISTFETLNGEIGVPEKFKDNPEKFKYKMASEALANGEAISTQLISLVDPIDVKDKKTHLYNSDAIQSGIKAGNYNQISIMKNGKWTNVTSEKLQKELDLPDKITYENFTAGQFNPRTGEIRSRYVGEDGEVFEIELSNSTLSKKTKILKSLNKSVIDNGFGIERDRNGNLIGVINKTEEDQNGKYKSVPYVTYLSREEMQGIKTKGDLQKLMNNESRAIMSLDNYGLNTFKAIDNISSK